MTKQTHTTTFRAMGCQMQVWLQHDDTPFADDCLERVHALFDEYETQLTRFSPTSELSRLNDSNALTPVSDLLWGVITAALTHFEETAGLFNPMILNALEAAGYVRSFELGEMTANNASSVDEKRPSDHQIERDPVQKAVRLPAGVRLDLGGIGKGYTAQQAAAMLDLIGVSAYLIDAGGDLVAGGAPDGMLGWPVGIALPSEQGDGNSSEDVGRLWLVNQAMATSGVDYRKWQMGGATKHHIIDPRTGDSAETDLITATILADDLCTAEAWATAAIVAGSRSAYEQLCARDMAAVLITQEGMLHITPAAETQLQR